MPFFVVLVSLFGLLVGSFLNVCIYRIPRDISVIAPRSFCPECGVQIAWFDNIPVFSYIALRGRCRQCKKSIGLRYPAVEILTAVLFGVIASLYGANRLTGKWLLWEAMMVVLFWTDFEEQILPDELTLGGSVAGLIIAFFVPIPGAFVSAFVPGWKPVARSFLELALGIGLLAFPMWLLGFIYEKVRGREGLGFGDVKLLVLMSTFLGFENGLFATMLGAVGGSIIGVGWCLITRRKITETTLPFGSFLCAGAAITPIIYRM